MNRWDKLFKGQLIYIHTLEYAMLHFSSVLLINVIVG